LLEFSENIVSVSNSLYPYEKAELLDISYGSKLFACGTIVVIGGLSES